MSREKGLITKGYTAIHKNLIHQLYISVPQLQTF